MDSSWVSLTTLHRVDHKARTTNDHFPHTWVHEKSPKWATKKKNGGPLLSMKYWLFNRDPYVMIYERIPT